LSRSPSIAGPSQLTADLLQAKINVKVAMKKYIDDVGMSVTKYYDEKTRLLSQPLRTLMVPPPVLNPIPLPRPLAPLGPVLAVDGLEAAAAAAANIN
jgi:hypothetical protein